MILRNVFLFTAVFLLVAGSFAGSGENDEVLLKTCFPKEETTARKWEECKDEDCGLREEIIEEKTPIVEKGQRYAFLGGSELGVIWGATNYRVIGEDRVRFLLYIETTVTTKTRYYDDGYTLVPAGVIRSAFFSSFGEYRGAADSIVYRAEKRTGRHDESIGGTGEIQMVDLHCSAQKVKFYDGHTLYYRTIEGRSKDGTCVELLWEKPRTPLSWNNASSMTLGILTKYYCKKK